MTLRQIRRCAKILQGGELIQIAQVDDPGDTWLLVNSIFHRLANHSLLGVRSIDKTFPMRGMIFVTARRDVNMATLTACFDASGFQHDQRFLVVAGFISSAATWVAFEKAWQNRLEEDGISFFQMNQFASFNGQFRIGWHGNEPRRQALLRDLMNVILKHTFRKFGCVIENKKFRGIITDQTMS